MLTESRTVVFREQCGDRVPPEAPSLDRSALDHRALSWIEAGDTRRQHSLDGRGQVLSLAAFAVGGNELLEKQRVALGGADDTCRLDRPQRTCSE